VSLKVAIFEDDKDVADLLKEMMETKDFQVTNFYNLKDLGWESCDIILGDYRNKIVSFKTLQSVCNQKRIPLIAISGADTDYTPQLIKPFSIEDLQSLILKTIQEAKEQKKVISLPTPQPAATDFFATLFKKTS
jgi:DNA-binding NtrC family response regulator